LNEDLATMSAERMQQLQAMLAEEPGDTFLRYAIALEHKRMGQMEQAIADLEAILADDPKHVPSYYQLASLQAELGQVENAIHTCEAGALQCIVTNDHKARTELLALKRALLDEE
jgi:thioredoxin-like negative regulator of GroEL